MGLYSFRLPDDLVETLDALADRDGKRRADLVRDALTEYVAARTAPVSSDEAVRALDVLRKIVEKQGLPSGVTAE
jgi:metal-responsive CopG/Arc/MetJ family transcriptional regulator